LASYIDFWIHFAVTHELKKDKKMFPDFVKKVKFWWSYVPIIFLWKNTSCHSCFTYCSHKRSEWHTMYMSKKNNTLALQIEYKHHAFERWKTYPQWVNTWKVWLGASQQFGEALLQGLIVSAHPFQCWLMVILTL
jgi:Pyruvate/2-oxoacid:ferredoxin oxidoreductase delta subunit